MTSRRIAGILLAAGSAERMGFDKLTTPLAGKTALLRSAEALVQGGVTELVAAVSERTRETARLLSVGVPVRIAEGGATRQDSVYRALLAAEGADCGHTRCCAVSCNTGDRARVHRKRGGVRKRHCRDPARGYAPAQG